MIDVVFGAFRGPQARCLVIWPCLTFTWFPGQRSYALNLSWLAWVLTVAWGEGTRP